MQRYFITADNLANHTFDSDQVHHIKNVMRMKTNQDVIVCAENRCYLVKLDVTSQVTFEIIHPLPMPLTNRPEVTLVQGYPKSDKLEFILEKATELGVDHVVPVLMKRSIVKLDESKKTRRMERLRKITQEAAEQSHRFSVPVIHEIATLKSLDLSQYNHVFVAYEAQTTDASLKNALSGVKPLDKIAFIVGPEGGIDEEELRILMKHNAKIVSLGSRILRTETAGLYILSAISYAFE